MTRVEWLEEENEMLMAIAIGAKRLLRELEIKDEPDMPETMRLCELIERLR
ncbi:MAG TPA: hypothetical protein V6D09_12445 [Leptolyngbyaceae cyanobacterium]